MEFELLEINLISAQNLMKLGRRLRTYAVAWTDPAIKLRTRVDRVGGDNPTWNDKFIFRVPRSFFAADSSAAVSIEIYSLGYISDSLIGTVRLLLGTDIVPGVPAFSALQVRRPSGRFHGILNIAAVILSPSFRLSLSGSPAIGYQDLMGKKSLGSRGGLRQTPDEEKKSGGSVSASTKPSDHDNFEDFKKHEPEQQPPDEEVDSETVLKDWNGRRAGSILCGFNRFQRKIHLSPSDENLAVSRSGSEDRR